MLSRRLMRVWIVMLLFVFATFGAAFVGCDATDRDSNDLPDRFARRYLPFSPKWIPESTIPPKPQRSPQQVIYEVSEFDPHLDPTSEEQASGDDMVKRCFDAAVKNGWFDREKGLADGFLTMGSDSQHHRNDAYVLDGIQLDPERPEYLMYYADPDDEDAWVLTGFMFLADEKESRGHQFAGPLALWHYHIYTNARCWAEDGMISTGMVDASGECTTGGEPIHRSPEMVHVWLIDHPRGAFSTGMTLPADVLREGLVKRRAEHGF